jgi:hypothetical protein
LVTKSNFGIILRWGDKYNVDTLAINSTGDYNTKIIVWADADCQNNCGDDYTVTKDMELKLYYLRPDSILLDTLINCSSYSFEGNNILLPTLGQ